MEERRNDAAGQDAQIRLKKEECARSMGQQLNHVAVQDAQIVSSKEGFV
jgi:hypothetical protein